MSLKIPVLAGHPFAQIGRGEDIRCVFRAFREVGIEPPIFDIFSFVKKEPDIEKEFENRLTRKLDKINIFYINGDEVKPVLDRIGEFSSQTYNIVCPQWELCIYPKEWAEQLNIFDEIWAPSKFVLESIKNTVSIPIFHMPLPVQVKLKSFLGRRHFGIPESSYVFLFFFDFRSYIDRKNPISIIKAFENVCKKCPSEDIRLIIKINRDNNSFEEKFLQLDDIANRCQYRDRIIVIDKIYTDNEIKNLVRCCDCFISLHRSEGFGRGMAEAMFLGKPVIATAYSGNIDFMNNDNSCLVRYKLTDVKEEQYPFAQGQVWADPDIEHASNYMTRLIKDREYGYQLGDIASRYIRTHFCYRAVGLRYIKRIQEI